jgi:hypothetical protein
LVPAVLDAEAILRLLLLVQVGHRRFRLQGAVVLHFLYLFLRGLQRSEVILGNLVVLQARQVDSG